MGLQRQKNKLRKATVALGRSAFLFSGSSQKRGMIVYFYHFVYVSQIINRILKNIQRNSIYICICIHIYIYIYIYIFEKFTFVFLYIFLYIAVVAVDVVIVPYDE